MKMKIIALLFIISIQLMNCKLTKPVTYAPSESAPKIVIDRLGKNIESYPNSSGKFILFVQKPDPNHPTHVIKAIVIDGSNNKLIAEEAFIPGYIKWVSEYSLELLNIPGMIRANDDLSSYKKIIDLKSINQEL
jgi:hypothetical protein